MTDWNEEHPLDPALHDAAAEYNGDPPPFRGEAVWQRIRAERSGAQAPGASRRAAARWGMPNGWAVWGSASVAAAAMLVLGIGVGRWTARPGADLTTSPTQHIAVASPPARQAPSVLPAAPGTPAADGAGAGTGESGVPGARSRADGNTTDLASPALPEIGADAPFRVAALQHLGESAALLAAFGQRPDGASDRDVSVWAGELLGTTRLLLDTPAAEDPKLRRLLQDLELILAELAVLPGAPDPAEREIVERSLERQDLLPRLRNAAPQRSASTRT